MKIMLAVLALFLVGCATTERFVKLSEDVTPKAAMIKVEAVADGWELVFSTEGFSIQRATFPVTVIGSGVFITPTGHILTCQHLFDWPTISTVTVSLYNGEVAIAEVLYLEKRHDLGLIKVDVEDVPYAKIADPRKMRVGQEVLAVGYPLGLEFTVTHGIISALHCDIGDSYNHTQSDAFLNPGNSGGPLFNMKGQLVGINVSILPPVNASIFTGLGFSVNPGQLIEFLTRFRGIDKAIPHYNLEYWKKLYGRKLDVN